MLRSLLLVLDADSASRVVERAARLPLASDAAVTTMQAIDDRPAEIVATARSTRSELVVIGRAGFLGIRLAALMGAVPTLLARSASHARYRRPLVAIDLHGGPWDVYRHVREVAPMSRPRISSIHVDSATRRPTLRVTSEALAWYGPSELEWTRRYARGDASTAIARTATELGADLVVIGSRPRSLMARLLLGSVSRDVVDETRCDVLSIPKPPVIVPAMRVASEAR